MITEIFENLFKPLDPKIAEERRQEIYSIMDEFEKAIDPSLPGGRDEDIVVDEYYAQYPEVEWDGVLMSLEGGGEEGLDEGTISLLDGYKEWSAHKHDQ